MNTQARSPHQDWENDTVLFFDREGDTAIVTQVSPYIKSNELGRILQEIVAGGSVALDVPETLADRAVLVTAFMAIAPTGYTPPTGTQYSLHHLVYA